MSRVGQVRRRSGYEMLDAGCPASGLLHSFVLRFPYHPYSLSLALSSSLSPSLVSIIVYLFYSCASVFKGSQSLHPLSLLPSLYFYICLYLLAFFFVVHFGCPSTARSLSFCTLTTSSCHVVGLLPRFFALSGSSFWDGGFTAQRFFCCPRRQQRRRACRITEFKCLRVGAADLVRWLWGGEWWIWCDADCRSLGEGHWQTECGSCICARLAQVTLLIADFDRLHNMVRTTLL